MEAWLDTERRSFVRVDQAGFAAPFRMVRNATRNSNPRRISGADPPTDAQRTGMIGMSVPAQSTQKTKATKSILRGLQMVACVPTVSYGLMVKLCAAMSDSRFSVPGWVSPESHV